MKRSEILAQAKEQFGSVPGFLNSMPDAILEQYWTNLSWVTSDSKLPVRDKILVAFGAAAAIHCQY